MGGDDGLVGAPQYQLRTRDPGQPEDGLRGGHIKSISVIQWVLGLGFRTWDDEINATSE
jgi:hypothetical protein